MTELDADNVVAFLRRKGWLDPAEPARGRMLGWGVSNVVIRVEREQAADVVVKQSRPRLRVAADWQSRVDRVHREIDVMRVLHELLPAGVIPRVLFEDRAEFVFVMEAIAADHRVWKEVLLQGEAEPAVARRAGELLATIHAATSVRANPALAASLRDCFGDLSYFDELRLDPFYRHLVRQDAAWAPYVDAVVERLAEPACLVLADFSPKNILLVPSGICLVDFETAHFGDPGFDVGFFLAHLLLKTIRFAPRWGDYFELVAAFWSAYSPMMGTVRPETDGLIDVGSLRHLGLCLAARIDGKSPVDYLPEEDRREAARRLARAVVGLQDPLTIDALRAVVAREI